MTPQSESAGAAAASGPQATSDRRVPVLAAALVVAVLAGGALTVMLVKSSDTSPAEVKAFLDRSSATVEGTATSVVNLLMNYDATNLEDVSRKLLAMSTGTFRQQYQDLIAQGKLGHALKKVTASSRGQILDGPDVSFGSPTEATAIVRIRQTTQSNNNPSGQTFVYVMRLTMIRPPGEGWKADKAEVLSSQQL